MTYLQNLLEAQEMYMGVLQKLLGYTNKLKEIYDYYNEHHTWYENGIDLRRPLIGLQWSISDYEGYKERYKERLDTASDLYEKYGNVEMPEK